jgi:hypothetical protein
MKLPSFHDDYLVGYEVDCEAQRIVLKIKAAQTEARSSVTFLGVVGYCFVNDALGNIVYALEQVPPGQVIAEFRPQIEESFRLAGAPGWWASNLETAEAQLSENGISGFIFSSSIGMSGWVLASHAEVAQAQQGIQPDVPASGGSAG